jgi:hypothetical protein
MLGRAVLEDAWMLSDADRVCFGVPNQGLSRREVVTKYVSEVAEEHRLWCMTHGKKAGKRKRCTNRTIWVVLMPFFHGVRNAKLFRKALIEAPDWMAEEDAATSVLAAMSLLDDEDLDERPPLGVPPI